MSKPTLLIASAALLTAQLAACGGPGSELEEPSANESALFTVCNGGQSHCWREPSLNVTNFDFGRRLLCYSAGSNGSSSSNIIECSVSTGGVPSGGNRLGYVTGNTFPVTTKSIAIHDAVSQHTYVLVLGSDNAVRSVHGDVAKPWFDGTNFATQVLWALPVDENLQSVCLQKIATVALPAVAPTEAVIGLTCSGNIYRFTGAPGASGGHWEPAGASIGFGGLAASGWIDISSVRGAYGATLLSSGGAVWRAGFGGLDSHANPVFSAPVQLPALRGTQGQVLTPRGVGGPFVVTNAGGSTCTTQGCVGDDQRFYRFDFGTGTWSRFTAALSYTPTQDELGSAPFFGPQIADASTFTGAPWDFGVRHTFSRLYYWHAGASTPSLPSSGRSAGLARPDGLSSNFYRGPSSEVKGITLNSLGQWAIENLSSLSGSGPALGNISAYVSKGGYSNVTFRGSQAHLLQVAAIGNQWVLTDFFNTIAAPAAAGGPSGYARADQYSAIVYRGTNGHIYEVAQPVSGAPGLGDLMAAAPTAALAGEDPFGFVRGDNKSSVLYASTSDRHVRELALGSGWTPVDVTATVGGAASAGRVRGMVRSDGYTTATYRAADGHIWELSMAPGQSSWTGSTDLSGAGVPTAAGDPVPYVRRDGVNAIVFRVTDGRVGELALVNGGWAFGDLNQASNGAPLAKDTSTPTGYVRADGVTVVVYESAAGRVIELALVQSGWVQSDLTSIVGGP